MAGFNPATCARSLDGRVKPCHGDWEWGAA